MLFLIFIVIALAVVLVFVLSAQIAPPPTTPSQELTREEDAADKS